MKTGLDRLLESIAPGRTSEETSRRVDAAVNSFSMPSGRITDWDEFRQWVIRFHRHIEATVLRLRRPVGRMDAEDDWGDCNRALLRAYGPNGEKAAFEMARTGNEGGLYAVLKAIAAKLADRYGGGEISARVNTYWYELSPDEKIAAGHEYLGKHGHLLPSELTEGSGIRIRANLSKFLEKHHDLIRDLGRIGRS